MRNSRIDRIISESIRKTIMEDGLGGTSSFSVNSAAGSPSDPTGQQHNHIDVPFGMQRRSIYSPKKRGGKTNKVNMGPALARKNGKGGSISVNEDYSIGWNSEVSELYEKLKEMYAGMEEKLMDEIVGKIDEKTLYNILRTVYDMNS